jgi:glycosyltransferase involved in cell wall biosynthesis
MHQIALMFARLTEVIYVDNPGIRTLRWDHLPRIWRRITHSLCPGHASQRQSSPQLAEDLSHLTLKVVSPILYPSPTNKLLLQLNQYLYKRQVMHAHQRMHWSPAPMLWITSPTYPVVAMLHARKWSKIIYDCVDDFPGLHPRRAEQLQRCEDEIIQHADVIFVTAQALKEKMRQRGRNDAYYVPNGLDLTRFTKALAPHPRMTRYQQPVIGFLGQMSASVFDLNLVGQLAERHPNWSIVLVGPMTPELEKQEKKYRLHCEGRVAYEEVPAYLAGFDVAIVPFLLSKTTQAINPLKVYEYLASGLPVISTPLPELDNFGDLVLQTTGVDGFSAAITHLLAQPTADRATRQARVAECSWEHRFADIISAMQCELS